MTALSLAAPSDLVNFARKHCKINRYMGTGKLHPETIERLKQTGLTMQDFELANIRRQVLAWRRAWVARKDLIAKGNSDPSINAIKKAAKCHWLTAREAMKYSFEEVLEKVRQAFKIGYYHGRSTERNKGAGARNKPSAVEQPGLTSLKPAIRNCADALLKKLSTVPTGGEQQGPGRAPRQKSARELANDEQARKFQAQLDAEKKARGLPVDLYVKIPRKCHHILYEAKKMPSRFQEFKERYIKGAFTRMRNKYKGKGRPLTAEQQIPNAAAYKKFRAPYYGS
jgi:hypothetical protein